MAEESSQEKTEQPTQKRREEARQKGQVARSTELSTVAILAAGLLSLWGLGSYMGGHLRRFMTHLFTNGFSIHLDPLTVGDGEFRLRFGTTFGHGRYVKVPRGPSGGG